MERKTSPPEAAITDGLKIVRYTVNSEGRVDSVTDFPWQPVNIANRQAWEVIEEEIKRSRQQTVSGRVSCLHYYMTANQMNVTLLARYTGQPAWLVRLHLIPWIFRRLSEATLRRYADLFQVTSDDLRLGRLRAPVYRQEMSDD